MNTAIISAEIKSSDIPLLEIFLKRIKAKSIKIEKQDYTILSEKIKQAREEKKMGQLKEINPENVWESIK